ncbi:ribosomal RNA small subunit methyltransferase C [Bacterioplanes sanyensis]|uniref:class I SAM-dependent methyltransferase n=1 Tax=Bacterioplanes sanyensis TaxID=1249553 RepID=UPI00167884C1|nr:class I SAM-dependent methyltransferase [Bacterioplanes sanyensis]GGY48303.1 ribosomal RNA small subunit methyltransferase C [Bacterioplanes sanyensis]
MSAEQQLLLRHDSWQRQDALIVCGHQSVEPEFAAILREHNVPLLSWDLPTQQRFQQQHVDARHAIPDPSQLQAHTLILMWPKSKALATALLHCLAAMAVPAQQVFAVAANDAGGKSIGSCASKAGHSAEKIDSARRCSLWQLTLQPNADFNWLRHASSFSAEQQSFMALPGVFSFDRLDRGTAVLLEHLPAPEHGRVLDLGCGAGVIGLTFKRRSPGLELTLSDVDALALRSAELNSLRQQLPVRLQASDGLNAIQGRYDYIVCNPPFHQGKDTDYQFAQRLFADAPQHLTQDGQLWLIANRHLPYEEWAQQHFARVEVMVQSDGFKLLLASQQ